MKKALKITLAILIVVLALGAIGVLYITNGLKSGEDVSLTGVNPSALGDGTYQGTYQAGRWTNELAVTISGGKISDIQIVKDVTFSQEAVTRKLFDEVIEAQNTTVDAISGATVTCNAYLKAIENALGK